MSNQIRGDEMNQFAKIALPLLGLAVSVSDPSTAQEKDRSKIPDQYKWNLADIYPTDDTWKAAKQKLVTDLPAVVKYQGTLGSSAQQLAACLELITGLSKEFTRLYSYAGMNLDQDTRVQPNLAYQQEMNLLGATFGAQTAFVEPEILKIDPDKIQQFIKSEKRLEIYRHYLDDILRRRAHTGTEGEEKIIADAGLMSDAPSTIRDIFADADLPYPEVVLSNGDTVKI
jgi:oligoendopeptidase F